MECSIEKHLDIADTEYNGRKEKTRYKLLL